MSEEQGYVYFEDLQTLVGEIPADSIISRTIQQDGYKAVLFGFAAGQELSEHTASRPAMLYFVSGQARLTLGSDEKPARAGSWAHMPAHLPHSIYAETETVMLLLMI